MAHVIFNIYLILLFIGMLYLILRLHDVRLLMKTFIESAHLIGKYVDIIEHELRKDEYIIEHRVDKLHLDLTKILNEMQEQEKKKNK